MFIIIKLLKKMVTILPILTLNTYSNKRVAADNHNRAYKALLIKLKQTILLLPHNQPST